MSTLDFTMAASTEAFVYLASGVGACVAGVSGQESMIAPFIVPRGELYYWSATWQAGERESLAALGRGERRVFDSDDPTDAVRWLLDGDE